MVRKLPALMAALIAALGAGALAVTLSSGSSHREAPLSSIDPTADDTDVYAFKAADAPNALTIVANWIPFEDPAGGPNFYRLDDRAAYYLNVDNTGDGRVFVGQVDDPFFVDLGTTFDAIHIRNGTGNAGGGKDDLAGYNVHSIVLQVPKTAVTRDGKDVTSPTASDAVVGVWSSTEREAVKVVRRHKRRVARTREVQVSRLGNPLVNEVVIPLGKKDFFNSQQPSNDLKNFGKYVVTPQLAKIMNALFPGLNVPETDRTDIVQALLTGIPGLTQIAKNAPPTDTLKINLGVAPNPNPNRFGVLANDTQGFPNGRRLSDDITDIELRVVGGFLKGNKLPLGDGVDSNDVPFRNSFPYVAPPHDGFDSQLKRAEPA